LIYDVFKNVITRRLHKQGAEEVFTTDAEGRVLLYSKGNTLIMQSLQVHPSIEVYLRPIFFAKDHLRNPGKLVEEKQDLMNLTTAVMNSYTAMKTQKKLL